MILYTCLFSKSGTKQMVAGMSAPFSSWNCTSIICEATINYAFRGNSSRWACWGIQEKQWEKWLTTSKHRPETHTDTSLRGRGTVGCVIQPQSPNELPGVRKWRQRWKVDSNVSFPPLIENISRNPICTSQNTTIWHIRILPTTAQTAIRCCL